MDGVVIGHASEEFVAEVKKNGLNVIVFMCPSPEETCKFWQFLKCPDCGRKNNNRWNCSRYIYKNATDTKAVRKY